LTPTGRLLAACARADGLQRRAPLSIKHVAFDRESITHEKKAHNRTSGRMMRAILTLRAVFRMMCAETLLTAGIEHSICADGRR